MLDYNLIINSISALAILFLASITFYIEIIKPWINKPKFEIKFQERNEKGPYTHVRDVKEGRKTVSRAIGGGRWEYYKARHLELDVINNGKTPAYNCEAKCKVWKDGEFQPVEPLLLYWSRKLPFAKQEPREPESIQINRKDREELRFLVLHFWSEGGTKSYWQKYGVDIQNLHIEGFRPFNIQKNKRYNIKIIVFSENSDAVSKTFELQWDGRFNLKECVRVIQGDVKFHQKA